MVSSARVCRRLGDGPAVCRGEALAPVPDLTNLPSISGSPEQGQTVACSSGGWTNTPTSYTYTWKSGTTTVRTNATAATSDSYTLQNTDVGQAVTCTVDASTADGTSLLTMTSAAITPVALPTVSVPVLTAVPTISGSPQQGQPASSSTGSWSNTPTSFTYTWQRDGSNIPAATSSTYTLLSDDAGHSITCTVVAINGLGSSAGAISLPILPVALPAVTVPVETAPPSISGTPQDGQTVSCSPGSWLNNPTSYSYTWQRTGSNISGATSASYTLTGSDIDQAITCTVVAHNGFGDSFPAISLPILPVAGTGGSSTGSGGSGSSGGSGGSGGSGTGGGTGSGSPVGSSRSKLPPPRLIALSVVPGRVRVSVARKRQTTSGTTFRFTLDKAAGVLISVQRRMRGRTKGKSCVAVTARNAKAKPSRYVAVATLAVSRARAGVNELKYTVREGKRALGAGTYRAIAAAANSAGWSNIRSVTFVVVAKKMPARRPGSRS